MVKQIFWKKEIKDYQGSMETDFLTEYGGPLGCWYVANVLHVCQQEQTQHIWQSYHHPQNLARLYPTACRKWALCELSSKCWKSNSKKRTTLHWIYAPLRWCFNCLCSGPSTWDKDQFGSLNHLCSGQSTWDKDQFGSLNRLCSGQSTWDKDQFGSLNRLCSGQSTWDKDQFGSLNCLCSGPSTWDKDQFGSLDCLCSGPSTWDKDQFGSLNCLSSGPSTCDEDQFGSLNNWKVNPLTKPSWLFSFRRSLGGIPWKPSEACCRQFVTWCLEPSQPEYVLEMNTALAAAASGAHAATGDGVHEWINRQ